MNRDTTGTLIAGVTLISRYRIVEMIGEGSFGAVYKAIDERFRSKPVVALKEMSGFQLSPGEKANALQNFHNEADLLAQIKHPNLPNVSDVFEEDGKAYLVMEFIEGKTLAKIQEERKDPLDEHLVMSWALKLCAVLHYLHTQPQPIIFRDMKPTNVMVTADGEIKLIDFGIARIFKVTVTKDTTLLGSHGYAPLEQYGRGQSDARSDIYALGATLYDLLTKEVPADSPSRRANPRLFSTPRQLNPNISPAVEAIVLKAMAEDPQDRYPTATDMFNEIVATGLASSALAAIPTSRSISGPTNNPATSPTLTSAQANTILAPLGFVRKIKPPLNRFPSGGRIVAVVLILCLLLASVSLALLNGSKINLFTPNHPGPTSSVSSGTPLALPSLPPDRIGVFKAPNGDIIGISDGRYAFDLGLNADSRPGKDLKLQASEKLREGNNAGAISLWQEEINQIDSNDAEALIYLENQYVLASGSPYITLVIAVTFTNASYTVSRDALQGAYIAQKQFNQKQQSVNDRRPLRILIARTGNEWRYTPTIATQIVQAAKADKTIVGVMGWTNSSNTINAIPVLAAAQIPLISQSATSDYLTGISPYFFRVTPPARDLANAAAKYAQNKLSATRIAIFTDISDPATRSSTDSFRKQLTADGYTPVAVEEFTSRKTETFPKLLQDALKYRPDLLYIPTVQRSDIEQFLIELDKIDPHNTIKILGSDVAYTLISDSATRLTKFSRLSFTSSASPDTWNLLSLSQQVPAFFSDYVQAFDPSRKHTSTPYGYTKPDSFTILSYDAMSAFFQGIQILTDEHSDIIPSNLQRALTQVTGDSAIQGVSGQIAFGPDHNPTRKVILVMYIDSSRNPQISAVEGCFLKGCS